MLQWLVLRLPVILHIQVFVKIQFLKQFSYRGSLQHRKIIKAMALVIPLLLILRHIIIVDTLRYCDSGTYEFKPPLGGSEVCELCLKGTFMPFYDHRYKECFNCTKILDPQLDVLISECNRTHDAVIQCIPGYYRRDPRNPREDGVCLKCSECHYPYFQARSCQVYEDTGCCLGENYDVVLHNGGAPVCRERPWLCRRGEYFSDASFECLPCPENSFMSLDYHSMRKCWDCDIPLGALHSIVIQPCNSTHPPVTGCEEGYFVNSSMGYKKNDIGCSPCTRCNTTDKKYEARRCDQLHDTVCCPEPDMTVEMTDGPKCQVSLPKNELFPMIQLPEMTQMPEEMNCGPGQFKNVSKRSRRCQNCSFGTYIVEKNHSKTACKVCPSTCLVNSEKITAEDDKRAVIVISIMFSLSVVFNIILCICWWKLNKICCSAKQADANLPEMRNNKDQQENLDKEKAGPSNIVEREEDSDNQVNVELLGDITFKK